MSIEILRQYKREGLLYSHEHSDLPLIIWNYTEKVQYEGLWDEVTLQCRGLITDINGSVVARPFRKFFNIEEGKHTPTSEFDVYEKVDGSLIIAFWYDGGWIIASRGSFVSEQAAAASAIFFNELSHNFSIGITYLFEFTADWNRIVVDYGEKPNLTLIGAIRTEDGTEATWDQLNRIAKGANCDVVKRYDGIKDYSILKDTIKSNQEGFVIRFSNGDRMKIKGDEYVRLHKIMTNLRTVNVWEALSSGTDISTILQNVPDEYYKKISDYEQKLKDTFAYIKAEAEFVYDFIYAHLQDKDSDKEFAFHARAYFFHSVLFAMRNGKDVDRIIWKMIKPKSERL